MEFTESEYQSEGEIKPTDSLGEHPSLSTVEVSVSNHDYEIVNIPIQTKQPAKGSLFRLFSNVPPTRINRRRVFVCKPSNPIPLYRSYVGKYPNDIYRQPDLQLAVLKSELKNLLSKSSQLGARLAAVSCIQPESLDFFVKLSEKGREMLNKSTEDAHSAMRAVIFLLIKALRITEKAQGAIRSLVKFQESMDSPHTFRDEEEVHIHNMTLLKPAIQAIKYLTKRLEMDGKKAPDCVLSWTKATELVRLVGEARFKVAVLEELYISYQSVYEQQFPAVHYLRRNSTMSIFAKRNNSIDATTKEKLSYLKHLVRKSKGHQPHFSESTISANSLLSQTVAEKQEKNVEKAMEKGVQMSRNEVLESAVRRIFNDREKMRQARLFHKHRSL